MVLRGVGLACMVAISWTLNATADDAVIERCDLANDQRQTFNPNFEFSGTYDVWVDPDFAPIAKKGVLAAIDEWNKFGQAQFKSDLFKVVVRAMPKFGGDYHVVNDFKLERLARSMLVIRPNLEFPDNLGNTFSSFFQKKAQALILIGPNSLAEFPDDSGYAASVALHELGHALGVGHSCAQSEKASHDTGALLCDSLEKDHPYLLAVMNPVLLTTVHRITHEDTGEVEVHKSYDRKDTLRFNDRMRAYCHLEDYFKRSGNSSSEL